MGVRALIITNLLEEKLNVSVEGIHLRSVVVNTNYYLYNFGNSRFYLIIGKNYYQRCYRSWLTVTESLNKFIENPKPNYSSLMMTLDNELQKFPKNSFYAKQLRELAVILAKGLGGTSKT